MNGGVIFCIRTRSVRIMMIQPVGAELSADPHQTRKYAKKRSIEDVLLKINILLLNYSY